MPTIEDILYHTVDGVFAVDAKQRIIFWDPGCEELFDRSSQWVLGRPCHEVICGKKQVSGQAFCQPGCCIACKPTDVDVPNNFTIQTSMSNDQPLTLSVNIMLLPSFCKKKWLVTHLLHRFVNQDMLGALETTLRPRQVAASSNLAVSLGQYEYCTARLSQREMQVLQLLAEGLSTAIIAKRLAISNVTIRNHIQHIQHKLGVHSQVEVVAYAYRHNLVH